MENENDEVNAHLDPAPQQPKRENILLNWIILVVGFAAMTMIAAYFAGIF